MSEVSTNAMQQLLADIKQLYNNSLQYLDVLQAAVSSSEDTVTITLTNDDGSTTSITVPSFASIQRRMAVIEQNMKVLTGLNNGEQLYAQLVDANNNMRTMVHMSLLNQPETLKTLQGTIAEDNNVVALGNDMLERTTALGMHVQIDVTGQASSYLKQCQVTKYICSDVMFAALQQIVAQTGIEMSHAALLAEIDAHGWHTDDDYTLEDFTVNLRPRRATSSGSFKILKKQNANNGTIAVKLDSIVYDAIDAKVAGSLTLKVGDTLSDPTGSVLLQIVSIDKLSQTCILQRTAGLNALNVEVTDLVFVEPVVRKVVEVPLRHSEKFVLFLSPVHDAYNTVAQYSPAVLIDTATLTIRTATNELVNANSYMLSHGDASIGAYIAALTTDMLAPSQYAIKPNRLQLSAEAFKVIQLNTHLIDNTDKSRILSLYNQKRAVQQEMSVLDSDIASVMSKLNTNNFKNDVERQKASTQYVTLTQQRAERLQTLTNIIDEMLNINGAAYDALYNPKFRVRGFLPVQDPAISRFTAAQNIVQFKVQYRYASLNGTVAKTDTFDIENAAGTITTAAFSTWNEVFTPLRRKIIVDGSVQWEPINSESIDAISCNQLEIPISANEIVQFRVKAIGEAGYPNVLNESEWSNIVSIQFPESLAASAMFVTLKDELAIDKQNVALENMLENKGLIKHIADAFSENNIYYAHNAQNIASGFFTSELAKVTTYEKLLSLSNEVAQLKDIILNQGSMLRVAIVDDEGNQTEILNGSSNVLFAGTYADKFDITSADNYGKVLTRQYWLKFYNIGAENISLYPRYHGDLSQHITDKLQDFADVYDVPVVLNSDAYDSNDILAPYGTRQYMGQALYAGLKNVAGTEKLYVAAETPSSSTVETQNIDTSAQAANRKFVHKNGDDYEAIALKSTVSPDAYNLMSVQHPAWIAYSANKNEQTKATLTAAFAELAKFNSVIKSKYQQILPLELTAENAPKCAFTDNDVYAVGANSRGAFLLLNPTAVNQMQVSNSTDSAAYVVKPGENNALLIPLLFQARMTDAVGSSDIDSNAQQNKLSYTKTMNFICYIGGKEFTFDIKVYADFRSTTSIIGTIPVASITSIVR